MTRQEPGSGRYFRVRGARSEHARPAHAGTKHAPPPLRADEPVRDAPSLERSLLRMQRQRGNRYVGQMLGAARAGAGTAIDRACAECAERERERRAASGRSASPLPPTDEDEDRVVPGTGRTAGVVVQRTIGDGHDLTSPRFAGDPVLEGCFDNERVLRTGASGEAVRKVQQALVDAGFPLPKFGVDAVFGSETRSAVIDFQRAQGGIAVDGIVGPQTMGALDARFSAPTPPVPPAPVPPAPVPPAPVPPAPVPPAPVPPAPVPPAPVPPAPVPPAPVPPAPVPPAPAATITSQTVVTQPSPRTRTTIGVGEEVDLTHSAGSTTWTTTAGTLSSASGATVRLTAPDTAQSVTVTGGTATLAFTIVAPTSVTMDRQPGTGVKHTLNRADSGVQTRVFLGPDTVNFSRARYRELDVAGVATAGAYSCNTFSGGHCGAGAGSPCPDKALSTTVTAGMGTLSVLGDCAYSGHCGGSPPFVPGSITVTIPYEYRVGTGAFRNFATVVQLHTLAGDASTLTTSKAGATGTTTVTSPSVTIAQCP